MVTDGRIALSPEASARTTPWRLAVIGSVTLHGAVAAGLLVAAATVRPPLGADADSITIEIVAESAAAATIPAAEPAADIEPAGAPAAETRDRQPADAIEDPTPHIADASDEPATHRADSRIAEPPQQAVNPESSSAAEPIPTAQPSSRAEALATVQPSSMPEAPSADPQASAAPIVHEPPLGAAMPPSPVVADQPTPPADTQPLLADSPPTPPARSSPPPPAGPRAVRRPVQKPSLIPALGRDGEAATSVHARAATPAALAAAHIPATAIPVVTRARYREPPAPPVYPRRARDLNITGTTILRALVDRDGRTKEVRVWRSSGSESLDDAAASAARRWAFAPAQMDDRAVEAWVEIPVKFELR